MTYLPIELSPAIWDFPVGGETIVEFTIERPTLDGAGIREEKHYEQVEYDRTSIDPVGGTEHGFTNIYVELARYWMKQDSINFSTARLHTDLGAPVIFGPGPFAHRFLSNSEGLLAGVQVAVAPDEAGEAERRMGHSGLIRAAWLSLSSDLITGDAPVWCSRAQRFMARSDARCVFGYVKEGCVLSVAPILWNPTSLAYRKENALQTLYVNPQESGFNYP